jgi:hypothetical protein
MGKIRAILVVRILILIVFCTDEFAQAQPWRQAIAVKGTQKPSITPNIIAMCQRNAQGVVNGAVNINRNTPSFNPNGNTLPMATFLVILDGTSHTNLVHTGPSPPLPGPPRANKFARGGPGPIPGTTVVAFPDRAGFQVNLWKSDITTNSTHTVTFVATNSNGPTTNTVQIIITALNSTQQQAQNQSGGQQSQSQVQGGSQQQQRTPQQQWGQMQQYGRISGRGTVCILKRRFNPKSGKVELIKNGVVSRIGYLNLKGKNLNRRQALRNYRYR